MSDRVLIDTNVIVCHLIQDHPAHARMAAELFTQCDRGEIELALLPAVLSECVFVLESFYKAARSDIADAMILLVQSPGLLLDDVVIHVNALQRYAGSKLHFVDCTIAAFAADKGLAVATFDDGFSRFRDIKTHKMN